MFVNRWDQAENAGQWWPPGFLTQLEDNMMWAESDIGGDHDGILIVLRTWYHQARRHMKNAN